jgi:ribonucleoside-diphosphate reductase alpha chain
MIQKRKRPDVLEGKTVKVKTGCGNLYTTLNSDGGKLIEVFAALGKSGSCTKCVMEGIARIVSLALKYDVPVEEIVKQLKGLQCPSPMMWPKEDRVLSCPDCIAKVLEEHELLVAIREVEPTKSEMEGLESVSH